MPQLRYYYKQGFLPTKRSRVTRYRYVEDTLSFDYYKPSKEEFPVAFIIHRVYTETPKAKDAYEASRFDRYYVNKEIRVFNGDLYKPVCYFDKDEGRIAPLDKIEQENFYIDFHIEKGDSDKWTENSIIVSSNKEKVRKICQQIVKNCLLYDGVYWLKTNEPRYKVEVYEEDWINSVHITAELADSKQSFRNVSSFSAFHFEDAYAYAEKLWYRHRIPFPEIKLDGKIEVLMPEMVTL